MKIPGILSGHDFNINAFFFFTNKLSDIAKGFL